MDIIIRENIEKLLLQKWADFIDIQSLRKFVTSALKINAKSPLSIRVSKFYPENNYFIIWMEIKVNNTFHSLECKLTLDGNIDILNAG